MNAIHRSQCELLCLRCCHTICAYNRKIETKLNNLGAHFDRTIYTKNGKIFVALDDGQRNTVRIRLLSKKKQIAKKKEKKIAVHTIRNHPSIFDKNRVKLDSEYKK